MKCVRFIKTDSKFDQIEFIKSGSVIAKLTNPKQGILPHDLIHAIVEHHFKIRGFTEMVFEGQSPQFAMNPDGEAWLAEAMVESIQGMLWSDSLDHLQFNEWVGAICRQRRVASFAATAEQFFELELTVEDVTAQWKALNTGGSLELPWPH